ncbi:MAG: class I SAM-dependent methyltransferase [Acidobacteriota bacterium]|nr:class I SAM-dependent methyltransferase [Acidobacteriota bacterium]
MTPNMKMALYADLVPWYHLVDPAEDHLDEADAFEDAFTRGAVRPPSTLLELGSGAGHNALHMKRRFKCTLTDLSPQMLARSQALNPECEHRHDDMRTVRLGRTFDTVLVHDAVCYMTTEEDLLAAASTAFVHTTPGGRAIFAPDCVSETFRESSEVIAGDDGTRALRCVAWTWDPDPRDSTANVEFAFLLREGTNVSAVHDRHVEGLFSRDTWERVLASTGYSVETMHRPIGDGEFDDVFLCRRRADP